MLEWLKRRVWKARDLPKGFAGSNPALSAQRAETDNSLGLFLRFEGGIGPSGHPVFPRCSAAAPRGLADSASLHRVPHGRRIAPPSRHGAEAPSLRSEDAGGTTSSLQSSYATGKPLQACSVLHRRNEPHSTFLLDSIPHTQKYRRMALGTQNATSVQFVFLFYILRW